MFISINLPMHKVLCPSALFSVLPDFFNLIFFFLIFTFHFILFCFVFYFLLFLEQLGLGLISHAVTSVTNWWRSHKTDHGVWENEVKSSETKWRHTVWTTHVGLMLYPWSFSSPSLTNTSSRLLCRLQFLINNHWGWCQFLMLTLEF